MEQFRETLNGENSDGYVEVRRSKAQQGPTKRAGRSVSNYHADELQVLLMLHAIMVDFCCPCLHGHSMWIVQHLIRSICTAGFAGPIHNCSSNVAYFTPGKPLNARDVPHTRPNKWWEEAAAILTMLIFFGCAHTDSNISCIAGRASLHNKLCLLQRPPFIWGEMSQPMPMTIAVYACVNPCAAWSASS